MIYTSKYLLCPWSESKITYRIVEIGDTKRNPHLCFVVLCRVVPKLKVRFSVWVRIRVRIKIRI
jgi:hypothetical protein